MLVVTVALAIILIVKTNWPVICAVLVIAAPLLALEALRNIVSTKRFTLRTLLIATTVIAFVLAIAAYLGVW
jgi:hypothetical protein